ncbi:MAG: hypothetical protein LBV04_08235, partial [Deferribacteraceae bacterium]|nr:hypothetical protein [Deferribacteraceae bacterium]
YYDLEREGQCQAYTDPELSRDSQVWLHWDAEQKAMVASIYRNYIDSKDGPLPSSDSRQLPLSLLTIIIGLLAQDGDATYFASRLLEQFIEDGQIGADVVQLAMRTLLQSPAVSPAKLVRSLEASAMLLPVLWPMLTEGIKAASIAPKPPVWVNRLLDIALRYAPYLKEAAKRSYIPVDDAAWHGLEEIAQAKTKSAAVDKAKKLLETLK